MGKEMLPIKGSQKGVNLCANQERRIEEGRWQMNLAPTVKTFVLH